ncbi:MAG: NUDIX domain-containing protein, partial [Nitrospirae bacterium]|nr:NUDIX domain-containing protein [Nitrospirota bacterium]
ACHPPTPQRQDLVNKDVGAWGIPKGEIDEGEVLLAAARREFEEETGFKAGGAVLPLAPVRQRGGKIVHAWAMEGDCDPEKMKSNTFTMEWPPHSGRQQEFPEVDRAGWFALNEAKRLINPAQAGLLEEVQRALRMETGD